MLLQDPLFIIVAIATLAVLVILAETAENRQKTTSGRRVFYRWRRNLLNRSAFSGLRRGPKAHRYRRFHWPHAPPRKTSPIND